MKKKNHLIISPALEQTFKIYYITGVLFLDFHLSLIPIIFFDFFFLYTLDILYIDPVN